MVGGLTDVLVVLFEHVFEGRLAVADYFCVCLFGFGGLFA